MSSRSFRPLVLVVVAVGLVTGLTATSATAATAASGATPTSAVIAGDVTGDAISDRVTLGTDGRVPATCSARVRKGLPGGGVSTTGTFTPLPVRATTLLLCPDLGVVVVGKTPAAARLAVAWSSVPPVGGPSVQFFRWSVSTQSWTYDGGTDGQYQPSSITSRDIDGDGVGDLVEATDQGSGVTVLVGRGSTYTQRWSSAPSTSDDLSFANFDHHAGVDVLDGHSFFGSSNVGVTVVDGLTGTQVVLIADGSVLPSTYLPKAVDLDGDGWLDVRVRVYGNDGTRLPDITFRNRATGKLAFTRV